MKISKIPGMKNYGVYIDDVDFDNITDDEWEEIGRIHLSSLVTIIRNTNLNDVRYLELMRKWGTSRDLSEYRITKKYGEWVSRLMAKVKTDPSGIDDDDRKVLETFNRIVQHHDNKPTPLSKVTGIKDKDGNPLGMFAEGELLWHSNEAGYLTFCPNVALLGYQGVVGSATGFVTTADWYESQSNSFRSELDEMIILHRYTPGKVTPGLRDDQSKYAGLHQCGADDTEIPLVIKSVGGICGMHYSVNTVYQVKGLSLEESNRLFDQINKTLFTDEYVYDHWYKNDGDLCLFDNSITLHRRLGGITERLCYRYQYDFDNNNIIKDPYIPYYQTDYRELYIRKITEIVNTLQLKKFKLPS